MPKKGICLVSGIYPPDKGGPAQFVSNFSLWLEKRGISSYIFSLTDSDSSLTSLGLRTIELKSRNSNLLRRYLVSAIRIRSLGYSRLLLINGMFIETAIATFFSSFEYVAKVPGDIVWERARNQGETTLNVDEYQGTEAWNKKIMRWFFLRSLKRAKKVIAPSRHLAEMIATWGIPRSHITVIRNGVDLSFFVTQEAKGGYDFDLITICRLTPWKGVDEIITEAAKRDLRLCVVGSGPDEARLKNQASHLKANVIFKGERDQKELLGDLRSARIFILNSSYEGSPHALIEAMAVEKLVIARDSTGSRELIDDLETGILSGGVRTLGEAIDKAQNLGKSQDAIINAARSKIVASYDRDKLFERILDIVSNS